MNATCVYCGKPITGKALNVHIIPLFAVKWAMLDDNDTQELYAALQAPANINTAHPSCRDAMGLSVPDIDLLHLWDESKCFLKPVATKLKYIAHDNMETVKKMQDYLCGVCHKPLGDRCTLRRINNEEPRSLANAVCIHQRCNDLFNKYKR